MIILGIANDETASACIIQDGTLLAAASEERFTRIKMDSNWPEHAVAFCLKTAGISLQDIDIIAYGWSAGFDAEKHLLAYHDRIVYEALHNPQGLDAFRERIATEIEQDRRKRDEYHTFVRSNGLQLKSVSIDHHDAHAYSAYCFSPFERSLVVTSDGRGDFMAVTVSLFTPDSMEVLYRGTSTDSLGFFYGRITALLGFTPHRHEGKITGLAAHGNPEKLLPVMRNMIYVKEGKLYGKSGELFRPFYSNFSQELTDLIASNTREDVAAAAQVHLEECITELVTYYVKQTGAEYVCMAGGVFANVRVNQCIMEIPGVKNIFIQPQMGDGGLCVGAAAGYLHQNGVPKVQWDNMYQGPGFTNEEIEAELKKFPELSYVKSDDVITAAVEAIINSQVVGWFQGRMEFGPRALCNRSIIYHCKDRSVNDWLNHRMDRTEFMPFAPVSPEEVAESCYIGWKPDHIASRYMTVTYDCTDFMKKMGPAAVHIDGTARPQVVGQNDNPLMYQLLKAYYQATGEPALINTSFNRHEEPIVHHPLEGIDALATDIVDVLIIGDFVVKRKAD
jgi:carbamoyltransferase